MPLDIVNEEIPEEFYGCDYGILMFVLSAIKPIDFDKVLKKISLAMKEGSILYFRDYARYDMAQLRFAQRKKNKIDDNLYMRKDFTLAYYFDKEEVVELFKRNGFVVKEIKTICRLIENRKDNKKMYRMWLQGTFVKI